MCQDRRRLSRVARRSGALFFALALVLAGCGGDDDSSKTPTPDDVLKVVTVTTAPTATVRTAMVDYVVAEGDTLFGIAAEFGVDPQEIVRVNNLANPDSIFVGQTLSIPAPDEGTPVS
jgi:LysM repeat protein